MCSWAKSDTGVGIYGAVYPEVQTLGGLSVGNIDEDWDVELLGGG
jgi:hypothetical protein